MISSAHNRNSAKADRFLRYTLDSGSARVFNCLKISRQILKAHEKDEEEGEAKLLFRFRDLNEVIYIKEAAETEMAAHPGMVTYKVNTKLYFPYDQNNPYVGGQSVFFTESTFLETLKNHIGWDSELSPEDYSADLKVLEILNSMPTLDPFLVRDKMDKEGVECDERYFAIQPEEWAEIQHHIRAKLEPMVKLAMQGELAKSREQVKKFMDKIWHLEDITDLVPLIQAFRLPIDKTEDIFYSWKGLAYYEFQYTRNQERIRMLAEWLATASDPLDYVKPDQAKVLKEYKNNIKGKIKAGWSKSARIFAEYNNSYDELFVKRGSPAPFATFMGNAPQYFWSLGDVITRLYQSVEIWDKLTHRQAGRRLKGDQLLDLFMVLDELL
jgi:negative regulator of genetic competence, sporulation and motility